MVSKAFFVLALGLALTFSAAAQQEQGGNDNTGGNTTGGQGGQSPVGGQGGQISVGEQNPLERPQQQQGPEYDVQRRPIYLSGKVVMDTGEVPPELVVVERVCNGQAYPEGYTDSKGRFSFELGGDPTAALTDASVGGQIGANGRFGGAGAGGPFGAGPGYGSAGVDLAGCEVRASLPGFRSDSVRLGRRRAFDDPDIGMIFLHGLAGVQRTSIISVTTLEAPDKARSSYEKAMRELGKKNSRLEKAVRELETAVSLYPNYAAAWSVLGSVRMKAGDRESAAAALEKAVEADPQYLRPYPDLVRIHLENGNWERTAALSDAMLSLHPGRTQARFFKAVADFSMGNHVAAAEAAIKIQKQPDGDRFPQTHQMIGMVAAKRGEFEEAAKQYRLYLALSPEASSADGIRKQLREWEALGAIEAVKARDDH